MEVAEDEPTLKWKFTERRDGETAEFDIGGIRAYVQDCDGDFSYWTIRRGRRGPVLAQGETHEGNHWGTCLQQAEAALRKIVTDRIAELRAQKETVQ